MRPSVAGRFEVPPGPSFWMSFSSVPDFSAPVAFRRVLTFCCMRAIVRRGIADQHAVFGSLLVVSSLLTAIFPFMSFCTTLNAELPSRSKSLTRPSHACKNAAVSTPPSVGTSANDCSQRRCGPTIANMKDVSTLLDHPRPVSRVDLALRLLLTRLHCSKYVVAIFVPGC